MFRFFFQFILLFIFLVFSAYSAYSMNFEKIIINGNDRISNETILVFSEINDDSSLDENSINKILKKLYESGFFKDISIKIEEKNLIINVQENPIIQSVFIEGIKSKTIKKELYDDLFFNDKTSYKESTVFFLLIPSIKTVWIIGFSNTSIMRLLLSILTLTSLKKPDLYNFFKILFIEFSSKDLLS